MNWILAPFFLLLSLWPHSQPKGFSVKKITSKHPFEKQWHTTHAPKEPLEPILSQTFTYFTSGYQSYIFLSEDSNYVIKFFKQTHMELDFFERNFPILGTLDPNRKRKYDKRRKTRHDTYSSCKLAFEELAQDTQLIYIHLTKSAHLKKKLHIIDNHGFSIHLPLDQMEFVIQRKGELVTTRLKKEPHLANKLIDLVKRRQAKGIIDFDMDLKKNYGFIGQEPFLIDVGSLKRDTLHNEVASIEFQINTWLEKENL